MSCPIAAGVCSWARRRSIFGHAPGWKLLFLGRLAGDLLRSLVWLGPEHPAEAMLPPEEAGSMLRTTSSGRADGFKVWTHDVGDPINDGVAPKLIHCEPTLTPAILKRFECHVERGGPTD
jgi:hypothetical protein